MSFGDHLEELRDCLIRAMLGVAVATVFTLIFGKSILLVIFLPLLIVQHANGLQPNLQALAPADAFAAYMKIAFLAGLILAMPWVLHQIWRFVAAGLYAHERRFARSLTAGSSVLFILGVLFLYFIVLPIVLQFFISFNRAFAVDNLSPYGFQRFILSGQEPTPVVGPAVAEPFPICPDDPTDPKPGDAWVNAATRRLTIQTNQGPWSVPLEPGSASPAVQSQFAIHSYVGFVLNLSLAFGLAFETPLVVFFLAWSGLVSTAAMIKGRRYVIFGIAVIAGVITPPDVLSQLLLGFPMYFLFELGIWIAKLNDRRRAEPCTATT